MDSPHKMDIGDWQNSPLPVVPKPRRRRRFFPPTLIGILGTLLLHAMFIQSVSFGSRGPKPKPSETQESESALSKSTTDADGLVLMPLSTTDNANQAAAVNFVSSLTGLSKMKVKPQIDVDLPASPGLETLALSEDLAPSTVTSGADGAEQARLRGIYTGQIMARIDRVWRRPRTSVNENRDETVSGDSFQCEAQIIQDAVGYIQEILLPRCNGSLAWQHSLVTAIRQASPLPAPPDPAVFRRSITLQFIGIPFGPGASDDDYEIAQPNSAKIQRSN